MTSKTCPHVHYIYFKILAYLLCVCITFSSEFDHCGATRLRPLKGTKSLVNALAYFYIKNYINFSLLQNALLYNYYQMLSSGSNISAPLNFGTTCMYSTDWTMLNCKCLHHIHCKPHPCTNILAHCIQLVDEGYFCNPSRIHFFLHMIFAFPFCM